jgi:hypothetical protein
MNLFPLASIFDEHQHCECHHNITHIAFALDCLPGPQAKLRPGLAFSRQDAISLLVSAEAPRFHTALAKATYHCYFSSRHTSAESPCQDTAIDAFITDEALCH